MPIVGSFAGASSRAYGLQAGIIVGDFESITTTTATGSTADVTFSSIVSTYTHLQLRMLIKNHTANTNSTRIQFNGDTSAGYSDHYVIGNTSSVTAGASANASSIFLGNHPSNAVASVFAVYIVDILDYANTNKYKTTRCISGYDLNNTDGRTYLTSGNWRSTSAISSIRIFPGADSFGQYSQFALYGIKG